MAPPDPASVPWPSLVVGRDGAVRASDATVRMLGFSPRRSEELERRFEVVSPGGVPAAARALPWRRAIESGPFEEEERWRDRVTGVELVLRVRAREWDASSALVELDPRPGQPEQHVQQQLDALNEAILGRASGREPVSLRDVLSRLVVLACEMTGARYGALGVLARDGLKLKDFVYSGVSEETARAIGHLPTGRGLLGAVIREGRAIRVARMAEDARSEGFPAGHPPMTCFVGVPLRIGGQVFGNFYLADKPGAEFSETDERLLEKFGAQAGLTIAYARQLEDEERLLLQAVVEHAPYGLAYFPADPEVEPFGNPAATRMLGRVTRADEPERTYDLKDAAGLPVRAEDLPVARCLREGAVINVEAVIERRDGARFHGLISAAPVRSSPGAILGTVVVYQDISARKELERLREEFAAVVAHDLRTPLHSVLTQIEVLLLQANGEASTVPVATLQTMKRNGYRLERLTRDLLEASRIDARRVVLDRRGVDLPELVAGLVSQIEGALGTHAISVEIAGAPPRLPADPLRIEQILTNLLENASKFSTAGTPIRIVVAPEGDGVSLVVRDRGQGIEPGEIPHLFDRYYQTRRARGREQGLGLGLYITRGLVEAHGGRITVESTPGVGSTFRVWFPATTA